MGTEAHILDNVSTDKIQPIFVCDSADEVREFSRLLGSRSHDLIRLEPGDWGRITWQRHRVPGKVWGIIKLEEQGDAERLMRWVQLLSVSIRPTRLVVLDSKLRLDQILSLTRAGADGFLSYDASCEEILEELEQPTIAREEVLPEAATWLDSLTRASEELLTTSDPYDRMRKLLKIFKSQLGVTRSSVVLFRDGKTILAAGLNMPEELREGSELKPSPDSVIQWVIDNRRERLIQGHLAASKSTNIKSAVCAPLIAQDRMLGAVSFTTLGDGRVLTPTDLSTVKVFASMLSFAIANAELNEARLQSQRLATVGETTAMVSHCVKNNMQSVFGGLFLARRGHETKNEATLEKGLQMIDLASERLRGIVVDLLDFAKDRSPVLEKAAAKDVLREIQEDVIRAYPEKDLIVEIVCEARGTYFLDRPRLVRTLINVAQNASEAMGMEGTIRLSCLHQGESLVFAVADSGPGVPEETLGKLFDPFFSTKGGKGTGLGLAMVRKFVRECGGDVTAANHPELGGLEIRIKLPAKSTDDNQEETSNTQN